MLIRTSQHDADWLDRFLRAVQSRPEVLEAHRLAGDIDYILKVRVPNARGLRRLLPGADQGGLDLQRHLGAVDGGDQEHHRPAAGNDGEGRGRIPLRSAQRHHRDHARRRPRARSRRACSRSASSPKTSRRQPCSAGTSASSQPAMASRSALEAISRCATPAASARALSSTRSRSASASAPGRRAGCSGGARRLDRRHRLGGGDGGEDAVGDLAAPGLAQQQSRLGELLRRPRPVGRQLHQSIVLEDAGARHVAALRQGLAQPRELAQRRHEARRGRAGLDPGPGLVRVVLVGGRVGQRRQLLLHPGAAAGLLQPPRQHLVDACAGGSRRRAHRSSAPWLSGRRLQSVKREDLSIGRGRSAAPASRSRPGRRSRRPSPRPGCRRRAPGSPRPWSGRSRDPAARRGRPSPRCGCGRARRAAPATTGPTACRPAPRPRRRCPGARAAPGRAARSRSARAGTRCRR